MWSNKDDTTWRLVAQHIWYLCDRCRVPKCFNKTLAINMKNEVKFDAGIGTMSIMALVFLSGS